MKKQLQLVLLPTDKAEDALIIKEGFILPYKKNYFTQEYLRSENLKSFHLYAISDEYPKIGDYVYNSALNVIEKFAEFDNGLLQNKIVITTDKSLGFKLPTFTNDFINTYIERYNSKNPIKEIEVEYDCDHFQMPDKVIDILKVNTDNTVDVSLIENKLYTKEEVKSLILKAVDYCDGNNKQVLNYIKNL